VTSRPVGVYPPREDSFLLLPFARCGPGVRFLEVGSGSGEAALAAALSGARVVATDLNRAALAWLGERSRTEGLRLDTVRTDLARGLGTFDRIVANPPYLPTASAAADEDPNDRLALDGGPDGTIVVGRLLDELGDHLAPRGTAFVLVSSLQDPDALARIVARWAARGGRRRVVATRSLEGERLEVWALDRAADVV
jgi:release factor glutamine methyltransferase